MSEVTPLFLFSLPRAGSTLLQRMIAAHPEVATSSEPWLLLPCMDILEHRGTTFSTYGHGLAVHAIREFSETMAGGRDSLSQEVRTMVLNLYRRAAPNNERYFLDKTPRYHMQCESILEMFPEAKIIVLVRHPLAIVSSMLETFAHGKWYLYGNHVDLYDGVEALESIVRCYEDRILRVRYEDLISQPSETMQQVFQYLGLSAENEVWNSFDEVKLTGKMKDPIGIDRYTKVSDEPMEKWKQSFNNIYRIAWGRRYLDWVGTERLKRLGYDIKVLQAELNAVPAGWRGIIGDLLRAGYGLWRIWRQADVMASLRQKPWKNRHILR